MMKALLLGAAASMALTTGAAAAACNDAVAQFARDNDLTIAMPQRPADRSESPNTVPATTESRGLTASDRLAESGGVITPPETGPAKIIEPPPTGDDMATAPKVEPGTPSGPLVSKPPEQGAATRAQAEAMLFAARAAAQEGKEEQCFERLQQAQKLMGRSGRGS